ncbi:MAG: hypothetical protein V5A30_06555 [Haloarculaceae archaeon]
MDTDRRTVLKASGIAALVGSTGLAGCSGGLLGGGGGSGSSGPESWQYDPSLLGDASNAFFGSMDYATIYENRQFLPEETRNSLEQTDSSTPVSPEDIDYLSGVGGGSVSMMDSSGSGAGSVAVAGSFDQGAVTDQVESEGSATEVGEYEGYTLYEDSSVGQQMGPDASGSATVGISDSALVAGFAFASGTSTSSSGQDAVETAIDSSNGNADPLRGNNDFATTVADNLGDATASFGGVGDPQLIEQFSAMADSQTQTYVEGMRAGGFGMTLEGETTTFTVVLAYESAQAASDTGLADLVSGFGPQVEEQQDGINEVSASTNDNAVTITVEGDTLTLLEQANQTGGMTGVASMSAPAGGS